MEPERLFNILAVAPYSIRPLATNPPPLHHYTVWQNIGYSLLSLAVICAILFYWIGFRVEAKCLVLGKTTKRPCEKFGKVILGCPQYHRWKKPVAWIRYLGAAKRLDPWLLRLHITPPSFAPMPTPAVERPPTTKQGAAELPVPNSRMTREARIAAWGLFLAIIQTGTGILSLWVATQ